MTFETTKIKQAKYPNLVIDANEKDVVMIEGFEKKDHQIIFIERGNIPALIEILQNELTKVI